MSVHSLLMQLANVVCDLCQRQVDKSRLIDSLNLDTIVERLLNDHGLEPDFDQQLAACINSMTQNEAAGQTLVFERNHGELRMHQVDTLDLLSTGVDHYELVLFDSGNAHRDRWKHLFFPMQRAHCFVYAS
jgi:hypothetical protein